MYNLIYGVKSFAPFFFNTDCARRSRSERIPFDLTFGFAPNASETTKSAVAIKASLARHQAITADIVSSV